MCACFVVFWGVSTQGWMGLFHDDAGARAVRRYHTFLSLVHAGVHADSHTVELKPFFALHDDDLTSALKVHCVYIALFIC